MKWLGEAVADVERLYAFIATENPEAAANAARAILDGAELLRNAPELGRPMHDGTARRELFVPFAVGTYVLRNMLDDGNIPVILRVWHHREHRFGRS